MRSNETATATTGGPRVIAYLTGTGSGDRVLSGPNYISFLDADRPSGFYGVGFWRRRVLQAS